MDGILILTDNYSYFRHVPKVCRNHLNTKIMLILPACSKQDVSPSYRAGALPSNWIVMTSIYCGLPLADSKYIVMSDGDWVLGVLPGLDPQEDQNDWLQMKASIDPASAWFLWKIVSTLNSCKQWYRLQLEAYISGLVPASELLTLSSLLLENRMKLVLVPLAVAALLYRFSIARSYLTTICDMKSKIWCS